MWGRNSTKNHNNIKGDKEVVATEVTAWQGTFEYLDAKHLELEELEVETITATTGNITTVNSTTVNTTDLTSTGTATLDTIDDLKTLNPNTGAAIRYDLLQIGEDNKLAWRGGATDGFIGNVNLAFVGFNPDAGFGVHPIRSSDYYIKWSRLNYIGPFVMWSCAASWIGKTIDPAHPFPGGYTETNYTFAVKLPRPSVTDTLGSYPGYYALSIGPSSMQKSDRMFYLRASIDRADYAVFSLDGLTVVEAGNLYLGPQPLTHASLPSQGEFTISGFYRLVND